MHVRRHIVRSIALLLLLALAASACGDGDETSAVAEENESEPTTEEQSAAEPQPEQDQAEEAESEPTAAPTAMPAPEPQAPAVFDEDAPVYPSQFSPIAPGTHRVDQLGTPFSFTVEGDWMVQPNEAGWFVLTEPTSLGPGDRDVVFLRPTGLSDPDNMAAPAAEQEGWELDDIDGWLDNLPDTIAITNRAATTIGGRDAVGFDLTVSSDFTCGPDFCAGFVANGPRSGFAFQPDVDHRVFWITEEVGGPITVILGAGAIGPEWFDIATPLLATVAFGPSGPHPIDPEQPEWEQCLPSDVAAGTANLNCVGVSFELAQNRFVFQNNGLAVVDFRVDGGFAIFRPKTTGDGTPVSSADEVVDLILAAAGDRAAEIDDGLDLPYEARTIQVMDGPAVDLALKWDDAPGREWRVAKLVRMWVVDTPDGPVVLSAETEATEADLAAVINGAEALLPTVGFFTPS